MTLLEIKQALLDFGCLQNEYFIKYFELIENNFKTKYEKFKTDKHHILPRCYFKLKGLPIDHSSSNLVYLSHIDHLLAHYYLYKCSSGIFKYYNSIAVRYVETKYKLSVEYFLENQAEYQQLLEDARQFASKLQTGRKNPHTPEWNKKISEANKGRKWSEEQKQLYSSLYKGRKLTSIALYNVQHEDRTNLIAAHKTAAHREKCRQNALGNKNKLGWKAPESTKHLQSINNGRNRKIKCVETDEVFYNINECSNKTKLTRQYLAKLIKNNETCNPRLLSKYDNETILILKKYIGTHFIELKED